MGDRMMNFHSSILQVASIIKNKEQIKAKEKLNMEKKKRERQANYSNEETNKLVNLILLKKDILESKKTSNADLWNEKKEAWSDIEREFNRNRTSDSIYRDSKTLRIKYESIKKSIKTKWSDILAKRKNSNGRIPRLTPAENKLKEIISLPMEGFCDFGLIDDNNSNQNDEDNSRDSSISNSNIEDDNCMILKKELVSDEGCFEESSDKIVGHDPLVEAQNQQKFAYDEDEPGNKRKRYNHFGGILQDAQNTHTIDIEAESLKKKLEIELLREELEIKKLQRKMMEQELEQKRAMHELEKEHLQLRIKELQH